MQLHRDKQLQFTSVQIQYLYLMWLKG